MVVYLSSNTLESELTWCNKIFEKVKYKLNTKSQVIFCVTLEP